MPNRDRYGPAALVTGASSGIGRAFARCLAAEGYELVLVARRKDRLEELSRELVSKYPIGVKIVQLDLTQPHFSEDLLAACEGFDIGLVVSNAGAGIKGALQQSAVESLNDIIDLNCRAQLLLVHALLPRLIARGRGGILLLGSIEAYLGFPYSAAYAATKAFVHSLGQGLWGELRPHGLDVLVVNPGATNTETLILQGMSPDDMPGLMDPERVAELSLAKLGQGPIFIPGPLNRSLVWILTHLPRRLAIRIARKSMLDAISKGSRSS
jgi:hypothetical protein